MTNNIKPEILILSNEQFGYLVDYYYYAKYLSSYFTDAFIEKLLSYDGSVQWDPEERYEFLAIQEN